MTDTLPEEIILEPRTVPLIAYDKKFCTAENSKLFIIRKLSKGVKGLPNRELQIRDADTGNLKFSYFPSKNKWKSVFDERVLKEEEYIGEEFTMKRKLVAISNQTFLFKSDHVLCTYTNCSGAVSSKKAKILAEFRDIMQTRKQRLLVLKGVLGESRQGVIYLGDPKKEGVRPVGKLLRIGEANSRGAKNPVIQKVEEKEERYLLEVAGGVDLLVILGMCVNFLEEKYKSPNAVVVPLK